MNLRAGPVYLGVVICTGLTVLLRSLITLWHQPVGVEWFVWAGLTLLSGSFTIKVPSIPARLSVSETFVFAAVLMFGPSAATIVVALDSLIISLWAQRRSHRAVRVLFNLSAPTISVWLASHVFFRLSGVEPLAIVPRSILPLLVPIVALAITYFLLNSWLIALAVAFEQRASALAVWRQNFLWLSLNYFSGASVAALLLPYLQGSGQFFDFVRGIGLLIPLLLISYLTLKTSLGRVEDANRHLKELNRLYLSTIETLAMAIDAKDQITHGHIRRVQVLATGLARAMGVSDDSQLRAVEAAALLHDMGKLAVPEYILNKPGPLSAAEFNKMKLHASVGADILSAIEFPYPVVPIVRHHHENWDGTGYPDGLSGSDIPLGARILSVVDCYDALTSDRPYRPRLSDRDALSILLQRRGTMYDPLIVDTFLKVHRSIAPKEEGVTSLHAPRLPAMSQMTQQNREQHSTIRGKSQLEHISASTEEMVVLYQLAQSLSGPLTVTDAIEKLGHHIRRLVPATTCVFYEYDGNSDELRAAHALGEHAPVLSCLIIPMGQRLSGWVAANRCTIKNSDPILDIGEAARLFKPSLRSCLSSPVAMAQELIGVVTLYSTLIDGFADEHARLLELACSQLGPALRRAGASKTAAQVSDSSGTSSALVIPSSLTLSAGMELPSSAIVIRLRQPSSFEGSHHDPATTIAAMLRAELRGTDVVVHISGHVVAVIPRADRAVADRILQRLLQRLATLGAGNVASLHLQDVGYATAPDDGLTLEELVTKASMRFVQVRPSVTPQVH
jgi:putative nucleotidyltransferase with HDIG domain